MDAQELNTWTRLSRLDFDATDAAFPFSLRLAHENGWSRSFAQSAIEEYRKFCFLATHAGHPVTPSDEVDQVWHLHLTYTRHYWDTLCQNILQRPLHHDPTRGGAAEARKHQDWYEATLASYRRHFGEPPSDIWPSTRERFHERNDFVRLNRRDVITLDRRTLVRGTFVSLATGGVLAGAHAVAQTDSSAETSAIVGLVVALVIVLMTVVGVIAAWRHRRRRQLSGAAPDPSQEKRKPDGAGAVAAAAGIAVIGGSQSDGGSGSGGNAGGGDSGGGGAATGCGGGGGGAAGGCGGGGSV